MLSEGHVAPGSAHCPCLWAHPSFPVTLLTLGSSLSSLSLFQAAQKLFLSSSVDSLPCE